MSELLICILSLSLSGTLLILLLFFCKPLLKAVPNKRWQYYLWLIVIARLLTPFAPKTGPVPAYFPGDDRAVVHVTTGTGDNTPFTVPAEEGEVFLPAPVSAGDNGDALWTGKAWEVFTTILGAVWLAGAVLLFTRRIISYRRFVKGMKNSASRVSDPGLLDLLSGCGEQIGVKRPVELAVNEAAASPMLIGFCHPCIILPAANMTESDFRYIFLHELIHERRWDILYKWLVQFTLCVHWFNPFVWLMGREIDRACELACDEAVISKLETRERIEYGDMLMNAVRMGESRRNLSGFMALYESKKMIRERLGAIMDFRKKSKWVTLGSISLALCLLALSVIVGAYLVPSFTISAEEAGMGTADSGYLPENNGEYKVTERDGVYYILCDGVDEIGDNIIAGVTDGCIMFAFLRADGYTSIGPFEVTETLVEDVAAQCESMLGADSPSVAQAEVEFLLELAAQIQSGNTGFADAYAGISSGMAGGWEVEDSIAEAVKHITVRNECSMLGEAEISHISDTVVRNVLETHAGIYSFDNVEVMLYNQFEENGRLVVDVEVGTIMTLIRDPLESPYVRGMEAAMEECKDSGEKEAARQILEAYLEDAGRYYNVPGDYATGFCYRVCISGLDEKDSAALEYEFYHRSGPDDDPILTEIAEHETFTEVFTEETGREFMMEEVERMNR